MSRHQWRFSELAVEATRNVFAPIAIARLLTVAAVVLGAAGPILDARSFVNLSREQSRLNGRGAHSALIQLPEDSSGDGIRVDSCTALATYPGVTSSGSITPLGTTSVLQVGPDLPLFEISPGLIPQLESVDLAVGADVAPGFVDGWVSLDGQQLQATAARRLPDGARLNNGLMVKMRTQYAPLCLVNLDPSADTDQVLARLTPSLRSTSPAIQVRRLLEPTTEPTDGYFDRIERFAYVLLGIVMGGAALVLTLLRGSTLAAYRLSGTTRRDIATLIIAEQAILTSIFVGAGTATLIAFASEVGSLRATAMLIIVGALSWMSIAVIAAAIAAARNPLDQARDR